MLLSVDNILGLILILISVMATYNAYMLRGGKLAWSQILIVCAMVSILISIVLERVMPDKFFLGNLSLVDLLFVLGFLLLLLASVKLHSSLK